MVELLITYKLKKDGNIEGFRIFSREKDQPIVKRQAGVHKFEVYELKKVSDKKMDFDIAENVFVDSYERWNEITQNDEMSQNGKEWEKYCDPDSVKVSIKKLI